MTLVLLLTSLVLARSDDLTTLRGEKFVGVTISRVEPDGIVVLKSDGIVKIPFTDLSPELRAKYGYNPQKAADFSAAVNAAEAQRQAEIAKQQAAVSAAVAAQQQQEQTEKRVNADTKDLYIEVTQVIPSGIFADPLEEQYIPGRASSMARIGGGGGVGGGGVTYSPSGKTVFVQGLRGLAEGERLKIRAYREGTHTYLDTGGASRTVEKWVFVSKLSE